MNKIDYGEIIPGESIGEIKLGMSYRDIIKILDVNNVNYKIETLPECFVVVTNNIKIWVNKNSKTVTQVSAYGRFKGRLKKTIGIGSTLMDIAKYIGECTKKFDTYELKEFPGICFELEDIDDWDENKASIDFISVYKH